MTEMTIIDHVEIAVRDAELSREFYEQALAPLGIVRIITIPADQTRHGGTRHGFGKGGYPRLWVHSGKTQKVDFHIAFAASDRAAVDSFYSAALAAGGVDNGKPGVRSRYHDSYYAAYVIDPDGINVEVVCQQ